MSAPSRVIGTPRPAPGPAQVLIQLGKGEMIDGVILSRSIWGVGTHWNSNAGPKGRSERCTKEGNAGCSGCDRELPRRWKGYLYLYCFYRKRPVFVELTPASAEALELHAAPDEPLRGQRVIMKRGDGGKKSRIAVEVRPWQGCIDDLPQETDPEPILETLWNWRR